MNFTEMYIANENPILIQKLSREHSRGTWFKFFVGCLIFYVLTNWIPNLLALYFPSNVMDYLNLKNMDPAAAQQMPKIPLIFALYVFAFQGVFSLGQALYVLTYLRNRTVEYGALFEGFSVYIKALLITIFQSIICSLWMFLFIIPGIIAWYGFRQSFYILADNPEKSAIQCMAESKIRMTGNKMNLFKLDISYIPYLMVGYLPQMILAYIPGVDVNTLSGVLAFFVADIPMIMALSLVYMGRAVFYELLMSKGFANFRFAGEDIFRNNKYSGLDREE